MTTNLTPAGPGAAADRELMAAARMMLQRMGVDPADLMTDPADQPPVPTFDAYIPEVERAVSPGTAKTYGSYWNRIRAKWGPRTLLEPTATEIKQFEEEIKGQRRPTPQLTRRPRNRRELHRRPALHLPARRERRADQARREPSPTDRETPAPELQPARPVD